MNTPKELISTDASCMSYSRICLFECGCACENPHQNFHEHNVATWRMKTTNCIASHGNELNKLSFMESGS